MTSVVFKEKKEKKTISLWRNAKLLALIRGFDKEVHKSSGYITQQSSMNTLTSVFNKVQL